MNHISALNASAGERMKARKAFLMRFCHPGVMKSVAFEESEFSSESAYYSLIEKKLTNRKSSTAVCMKKVRRED